jgi:hypothetical protein
MVNDAIHVTQELLALLSEIDEFKGTLGTIAPERLNALRIVATSSGVGRTFRLRKTSSSSFTATCSLTATRRKGTGLIQDPPQ